jgi:hypothetical protein
MNGFVPRLLNVTFGMTPGARPLIAPRFAPGADVPGTRPNYLESAVEEQGSAAQMVRGAGREIGLPDVDVPGAERGGHILYLAGGPPVQAFGSLNLEPERRAPESAEVRGLSPTFRSDMPGQSGVSDETRNTRAFPLETQESSEQRAPGATPAVNSAAVIGPSVANSDEVIEPPVPGAEQFNSSTIALRSKHIPAHHYPSETSEAGQAAPGKFPTHNHGEANGGEANGDSAGGATFSAGSRREASVVSIVSASDETEGVPPRRDEAEGASPGREGTDRRQDRGRSLASRWMESQREADGKTVEMPGAPVGGQPSRHTKQAVRDHSNSPNVADSPDVAGQPVVRVTIGRIEVRAISQPPPPPRSARPAAPRLSLDEYLASQAGRNR